METYLKLSYHEFSMINCTETWLNDSTSEIFSINGYNSIAKHRTRIRGGVALFIRDVLIVSERNDLAHFDKDTESVCIEIGKD